MRRRQFVIATGTATTIALAGCTGSSDGAGSPDGVVEAYYEADSASEAEEYHHPEAELEASDEAADEFEDEFDFEGAEIVAEEIDSEALDNEGVSPNNLDDETIDSVADDEEVTLVEAAIEGEFEGEAQVFEQPVITATDDGDWYILDLASEGFGL